jgi:ferredoxin--NADP+ reductase
MTGASQLRVAIVGAGPAGLYAATELLNRDRRASVDMLERLPVPGGLARYGVAPDHAERRQVVDFYARNAVASGRFRLHAACEVGRHVRHDELLEHCHAVIYASGASGDRRLGVPGEDLPGSHAATEFVAWYNGHPDFAERTFDFDTERAVVLGNGNVALDVARMLLASPERLRATDVAEHALAALSRSRVREVVVLGRRGAAQASFTLPELIELGQLHDVDVGIDCPADALADEAAHGHALRMEFLREYARREPAGRSRRLILRFQASPVEIVGDGRVVAVNVARTRLVRGADGRVRAECGTEAETVPTGLVLRCVGHRVHAVPALPFDEAAGVVPNREGRVAGIPGTYVTGWLKRGPSGVIGTNKTCAQQTVAALLDDAAAGLLVEPRFSAGELDRLLQDREAGVVGYAAWKRIDREERRLGSERGRSRVRLGRWSDLLHAARGES